MTEIQKVGHFHKMKAKKKPYFLYENTLLHNFYILLFLISLMAMTIFMIEGDNSRLWVVIMTISGGFFISFLFYYFTIARQSIYFTRQKIYWIFEILRTLHCSKYQLLKMRGNNTSEFRKKIYTDFIFTLDYVAINGIIYNLKKVINQHIRYLNLFQFNTHFYIIILIDRIEYNIEKINRYKIDKNKKNGDITLKKLNGLIIFINEIEKEIYNALYAYNDHEDIFKLIHSLIKAQKEFIPDFELFVVPAKFEA